MKEVAGKVADGSVLDLIEAYLHQGVLEEMQRWTPERGTPQGAVISPLLANIYLHPVDVAMRRAGFRLVRYADDMVVMCRTRQQAEAALTRLRELIEERGLEIHPDKTRIAHLMERPGFQFLGYVFYDRFRDPRASSEDKLKRAIRRKTKLTNGQSRIDQHVRYRLRAILDKRRRGGRSRRRGRGHAHHRWPNAHFAEHGPFSLVSAVKLIRQP